MKTKTLRALRFLRVLDEKNDLSITNLAVIAMTAKLLATPGLAVPDMLTFIVTVAGYQFKKWLVTPDTPAADEDLKVLKEAVESLKSSVTTLKLGNQRK
jgi:hypothetical protein